MLVPFQRVHAHDAPLLLAIAPVLLAVLAFFVCIRGTEASEDSVCVGVHAIDAARVNPRRRLNGAARLVEAVLLFVTPRGLTWGLRLRLLGASAADATAVSIVLSLPFSPAHEGVDDVIHVVDELQVEGILRRHFVLVDHLDAFRVEIAERRRRPATGAGTPAALALGGLRNIPCTAGLVAGASRDRSTLSRSASTAALRRLSAGGHATDTGRGSQTCGAPE
mmetsp:Transcript_97392/g.275363  ORF Transcript_97392/g.275363 Transcript_97392/m.275363 type:complete len:222 (-) Transcript_97392:50-715(-)